MKKIAATVGMVMVASLLAYVAVAQQPKPGQKPGAGTPPPRQGQRRGPNPAAGMINASKQVPNAYIILGRALPIYGGNRVAAMRLCAVAEKEILLGLKSADKPTAVGQDKQADNESASKYSAKQVKQSNGALTRAAEILEHVQLVLKKDKNEFDGHRKAAVKAIDEAIAKIRAAQALAR
ncbi:MAG: hypothetical protein JSS65_04275 [Armatimonadetes bacterium]|nr:hypothetical protein [Armatimonadota bacterium]